MSDGSKIEWTQATWNATTGCTRVSAGCDHCYIDRTPPFRMAHRRFSGPEVGATTGVLLHPDRLTLPLRWRKPRRIFVNSLSDLFHADVPDEFIARVFAAMASAPQHTFQLLTKRHARMRALLSAPGFERLVLDHKVGPSWTPLMGGGWCWPLPNVHLGVSVEDQHWADLRIPALLDTPAAVRWISAEPLLGPIDLDLPVDHAGHQLDTRWDGYTPICLTCAPDEDTEVPAYRREPGPRLDWVVIGGESGKGARPMHPAWARDLRDQCAAAHVPFYFKQWGEWLPLNDRPGAVEVEYVRVGRKRAGRELDGRTHDEYPGDAA